MKKLLLTLGAVASVAAPVAAVVACGTTQEPTDFTDMKGTPIEGQPFQLKILTSGTMFANAAIKNGVPDIDFTKEGNTRPYPQTSTTAGYWVPQDVSNGDKIEEINDPDNFKDTDVIAKNVTKLSSTLKGYAYQGTGDAKDTNVHVWVNKAAAIAAAKANVEYQPGVRVSTLKVAVTTLTSAEQKIITDANAAIDAVFNA